MNVYFAISLVELGRCWAMLSGTLHMSISIASYTVEVKAFRGQEPLMLRFESGAKAGSVHAAFLKEFKSLDQCRDRADDKHLVNVIRLEHDDTDIWGVLQRGEYGSRIPIFSKKTLGETHVQTPDEAAMRPYYFRLHLPHGATKGLLLLQRTGIYGAYTDVRGVLEDSFKAQHEQYRVHFARAIHPELLASLSEGKVYAYKIVTHKVPSDIVDYVKRKGPTRNVGKITISAEAKVGQTLWDNETAPSWFKKIIRDKKAVSEVLPEEQIDSLKITMEHRGSPKTFDLTKEEDIFPYFTITDDVTFGKDGHPDFDSIDSVCLEHRDDLRIRFGLQEPAA